MQTQNDIMLQNSSAHKPASSIYLLLCIGIHLVYLLLEVLLQLVPLELEAGCHEPIINAELLWDQVHCLDSLKAAQATLLADFVDLSAEVFSGLKTECRNIHDMAFLSSEHDHARSTNTLPRWYLGVLADLLH